MGSQAGTFLSALLLATGLTGCLGGDDGVPDHVTAEATNPIFMTAYTYNGQGVATATGTAALDATASTATGSLVASVTVGGTKYDIDFRTFLGDPARPFQGQGIAHDIQEHGATGNGDTDLPELHAVSAGWGVASLRVGDAPVLDPMTGLPVMAAHYMLTDTGIFADDTRQVLNTAGNAPYTPAAPADGRSVEGDMELHILLRSDPAALVATDNSTSGSGALSPQAPGGTFQFDVLTAPARGTIRVSIAPPVGGLPIVPATVNVTLLDPTSAVIRGANLGGQGQQNSIEWGVDAFLLPGVYVVSFNGAQGVANWAVTADIDYPEPVFLYFVFEDVTLT